MTVASENHKTDNQIMIEARCKHSEHQLDTINSRKRNVT